MKVIRIGFDLDGVIVDKPPLIPKKLLEWLVRLHQNKKLAYRFPKSKLEQKIRILSHHLFLRPPIKKNLEFIKKIAKNKKCQLYLISGRYAFLKKRTDQWLKHYQINNLFKKTLINLKNEQPHLFKKKQIKDLKIDIFIDDDLPLASYLSKTLPKTKIFCFDHKKDKQLPLIIESLKEVFSK